MGKRRKGKGTVAITIPLPFPFFPLPPFPFPFPYSLFPQLQFISSLLQFVSSSVSRTPDRYL